MDTEWNVVAQSVLDQLSVADRALVQKTVDRAALQWQEANVKRLPGKNGEEMVADAEAMPD